MTRQLFSELVDAGVLRVSDGYRAKNDELGGDGPVFLRSAYLQDQGFILGQPDRFQTETKANYGDKIAIRGDTVITTKGNSTGRVGFVEHNVEGSVYSPHLSYWRSLDLQVLWPRYLYYWSRSDALASQLAGLAYSTDMAPYLSLRDQMFLSISLPPVSEQREIAAILGALDDKIEVNRKASATLEAMARALYRSWFVDFDPVWAKLEGRPPAHMPPQTAALFPDSFNDDGLPLGWELTSIGEVADIVGGGTPATKQAEFWDDGHHLWATPKDLSNNQGPALLNTERRITNLGLAKISSGLLPAGSLLLSSRAPIGYLVIAQRPVAINQGFIGIRETDTVSGVEAYHWCVENMELIHANANGSTFQEIAKKNFRPLPYVLAPEPVRQAFNDQAGSYFARIATFSEENQTLATLRDSLLPRLMSGELRVGDARTQVEEVA